MKDYLISKGVQKNQIIEAKGFGESKIINACIDGVYCEEEQHQMNRRVEFVILN